MSRSAEIVKTSLLHEIHGLSECCAPGDCPFAQSYRTNDNVLKKNRIKFINLQVEYENKINLSPGFNSAYHKTKIKPPIINKLMIFGTMSPNILRL